MLDAILAVAMFSMAVVLVSLWAFGLLGVGADWWFGRAYWNRDKARERRAKKGG